MAFEHFQFVIHLHPVERRSSVMTSHEIFTKNRPCHPFMKPGSNDVKIHRINLVVNRRSLGPWYRLRLPYCGPGFESEAYHLCLHC